MAIFSGPEIVNSGLVLHLDAANSRSYPGSGTAWYDISGLGNHFTLYNSPTLTNNGFSFDGTNQYAQCNNTTCGDFGTSSYTIEYAVKYISPTPSPYNCLLMKRTGITTIGGESWNGWAHRVGGSTFFVQDDNPGAVQSNVIYFSGNITNNSPNVSHYVATITRSGLGITVTIYLNNIQIATQTKTFVGTGNVSSATAMNIFRNPGELVYTPGNLYFTRMYNRALSAAEIKQNFEASRDRYGI